jgi:hypothetical protein
MAPGLNLRGFGKKKVVDAGRAQSRGEDPIRPSSRASQASNYVVKLKEDNTVQDDIFSAQVFNEGEKLDPDSETMTHSSVVNVKRRQHGKG